MTTLIETTIPALFSISWRKGGEHDNHRGVPERQIIWVTSLRERLEHGVTVTQAEATAEARTGIYESLCGLRFMAAAMITPPVARCHRCQRLRPGAEADSTSRGRLRRILRRLKVQPRADRPTCHSTWPTRAPRHLR